MVGGGLRPLQYDEEGQEETARGVEPPNVTVETDWELLEDKLGREGQKHTDWKENRSDVENNVCFSIFGPVMICLEDDETKAREGRLTKHGRSSS